MDRLVLLLFLLLPIQLLAQPANGDCMNAIEISDVSNYCSDAAEYTNQGGGTTGNDCFRNNSGDVWFAFTTSTTSINIRALGAVEDQFELGAWERGSMVGPQLALYSGSCASLDLLHCNNENRSNIGELFVDDLTANTRYHLKVSGTRSGTFQLCLSSFNLTPAPQNDCAQAVVLCDKTSFNAPFLAGGGRNPDELDNTCLDRYNDSGSPGGARPVDSESATAWYKWVVRNTGTLSFVITPNNPSDDLDFALIRMPNGLQDCSNMQVVRCMASGAQSVTLPDGRETLAPLADWIDCYGPTGLASGDPDVFEEIAGCLGPRDNNFVRDIQVVEGEVYALVVDNFSNSQHGFSLEFGGSADFIAPEARFAIEDSVVCLGQEIRLTDESVGVNENLMWNFGEDASPLTDFGNRTPEITYSTAGEKVVTLVVEGTTGCLTTLQKEITVLDPITIDSMIRPQSCPDLENGRIELTQIQPRPLTSIVWDHGATGLTLDNLPAGPYTVRLTNEEMCMANFSFTVPGPVAPEIEEIVEKSTCGESDGSIEINITGQAEPYEIDFGTGFSNNNQLENLTAALYPYVIRDAGGCLDTMVIAIDDRGLEVTTDFDSVSCFGGTDGVARVTVLQANDPVQFEWNNNGMPTSNPEFTNQTAGTKSLEVVDALGCRRFNWIVVEEPDSIAIIVDTTDILCFGFDNGLINLDVSGGVGAYSYQWSNGGTSAMVSDLPPGDFSVTVTDGNQCTKTAAALIEEPPAIGLAIADFRDVVCFGDETGLISVLPNGGIPPYEFSADGIDFQTSPELSDLGAGNYLVTLRDANGCIDTIRQDIIEPPEIILQAERDTTVNLGFPVNLSSEFTPTQDVTYSWSPPELVDCADCPTTTAFPFENTTFVLTITNNDNCMVSDPVQVSVILDRPIFIPNAITPNGDGNNDRLAVLAGPAALSVQRLRIFDRWGEMVFDGTDLPLNDESLGWDGTLRGQPMNPGVFVYLAEILFVDNQTLTFTGDISLIR